MAYASIAGRARTSARKPQAHAICDRCGCRYNLVDLTFQYEWRGPVTQNTRILVCRPCLDVPQEQNRTISLPVDPEPVMNARVQDFDAASSDYRAISAPPVVDPITGIPIPSRTLRTTQDCRNRTLVPYGALNPGLDPNAVMPQQGTNFYAVVLPLLSVYAIGCTVTMTFSAVHNLQTDSQVSVQGVPNANGVFSVTVISATAFTYQTIGPQSVQMTSASRVATANIGLPRGYVDFPMTFDDTSVLGVPTIPGAPTNVVAMVSGSGTDDFNFYLEDGSTFLSLEDGTTLFEQETGP